MSLNENDVKELINLLHKLLKKENDDVEEKPTKNQVKNSSPKQKNKTTFKNKFDTMPERNMHKEDIEIDRKLNKHPPTERMRKYKPITVKCRVCGKIEDVNSSLTEDPARYKCNKCCTIPG